MPGPPSGCCGGAVYCCSASVTTAGGDSGPPCPFSSDSSLQVTFSGALSPSGAGLSAGMLALLAFMNAYIIANPVTAVPWDATHICPSDGTPDTGFNGLWIKQIGTCNGMPVWMQQIINGGNWFLRIENAVSHDADAGPSSPHYTLNFVDGGDGDCIESLSPLALFSWDDNGTTVVPPFITGASAAILVLNQHCCMSAGGGGTISIPGTPPDPTTGACGGAMARIAQPCPGCDRPEPPPATPEAQLARIRDELGGL